jgi:hypothetical protein
MVEHPLQRIGGDGAAKLAVRVGEQVRIRQVQQAYCTLVIFRRCLNRRFPQ